MPASEEQRWKVHEDQIIIQFGSDMVSQDLAKRLPGRSPGAVANRRQRLGVRGPEPVSLKLTTMGSRPLLAKTCTSCGKLLQAEWFGWDKRRGGGWRSRCRLCRSAREQGRSTTNPSTARRERQREQAADWRDRAQKLTLAQATRSGYSYVDSDEEVMKDPDLTVLQKALRVGRTYNAVSSYCHRAGYYSAHGLGEPTDLWVIFNPNEKKVATTSCT